MSYRLNIVGKTDKGRCRPKNEDNLFIEPELGFMIVADGIGGHASGEVASRLATDLCSEQLKRALQTGHVPVFYHVAKKEGFDTRTAMLGDCVKFANQAVFEAAQADPAKHNMGTTLVTALWLDEKLAIANVGDSRLYSIRNGKLRQETRDHSFVEEQIAKGLLKPEDAETSGLRNMLTRSIGVSEDVEVDLFEISLAPNDMVLLCSDGLTKMLDDPQIESVFKNLNEPAALVDELIKRANDAGGGDNVTVVIGKLEKSPSNWGSLADRVKGLFRKKAGTR